jgi:hypothetical protein
MKSEREDQATSAPEQRRPLPEGYRQGLITAITVLLGFSLAFFRFWGFETSGEWTARSLIAAGTLIIAVLLQIVALFRSLRLEDDFGRRDAGRLADRDGGVLRLGGSETGSRPERSIR